MTLLRDLRPAFRHVRLLLTREAGHLGGDREEGYDLPVPLDADGRIDAAEWKTHQDRCRVRRFGTGGRDRIGRLRRRPGGRGTSTMKQASAMMRQASA